MRESAERTEYLNPRWFVVCTQPNREMRAEQQLMRQGFRTFLPRHRKTVRHARQFRTVNAPLFPRYMFVSLDLGRDRWRSVNGTFGVSHLIVGGDRPVSIESGIVEDLISATDSSGLISAGPDVRPGDRVRFSDGPFAGRVGELLALDGNGRVRVLLEVLGTRVSVSSDRAGLVSAA